jgi:tRNA modification GTPase
MYDEDTIAAIATPPGEGAVAIIRISGTRAERIARTLFVHSGRAKGDFASHHFYHGQLREPKSGALIDDVLFVVMRKPRSYTGEDVVELHCHGGAFMARRVLALVLAQGGRHAERGEFTKRAFLNGRMDLAQAEAVLDVIRARTEQAASVAVGQATGELSHWVEELRGELVEILAHIEATIDFSEEEIEFWNDKELTGKLTALRRRIGAMISTYDWGRLLRDGAKVCICGRPNVGKSSLLNALLGEERVIVSSIPGTTRDVIEETLNLQGLPVVLWDTAGIRTSGDEIEHAGVQLSLKHVAQADAVLAVLDGSAALEAEDRECLRLAKGKKCLLVVNKSDLPQRLYGELDQICPDAERVRVSAKSGNGLDVLKGALRNLLLDAEVESPVVLTNLRHKSALLTADQALAECIQALEGRCAPELIAVLLQSAKEGLEEITGKISGDDILERIFTSFCIGK